MVRQPKDGLGPASAESLPGIQQCRSHPDMRLRRLITLHERCIGEHSCLGAICSRCGIGSPVRHPVESGDAGIAARLQDVRRCWFTTRDTDVEWAAKCRA